jgi:hypothetical protein
MSDSIPARANARRPRPYLLPDTPPRGWLFVDHIEERTRLMRRLCPVIAAAFSNPIPLSILTYHRGEK